MTSSSESSSPPTRLKSERVQSEGPARSTRLKSERVQGEARAEAGWEVDEEGRALRFEHEFAHSFDALAFAGCSLALATAHEVRVRCLVLQGRHLELVLAAPEETGVTERERRVVSLLGQLHQQLRPVGETRAR
jgi:hypothetical protein